MYPKISPRLTTAIAIFLALTSALPAPHKKDAKTPACSVATVDTTCIDTYNTCMRNASDDNDGIESCAPALSACTSAAAKRDAESPERRTAAACRGGAGNALGSISCVGSFGVCMKAADGAGEITSCALALSACEVGVNTK